MGKLASILNKQHSRRIQHHAKAISPSFAIDSKYIHRLYNIAIRKNLSSWSVLRVRNWSDGWESMEGDLLCGWGWRHKDRVGAFVAWEGWKKFTSLGMNGCLNCCQFYLHSVTLQIPLQIYPHISLVHKAASFYSFFQSISCLLPFLGLYHSIHITGFIFTCANKGIMIYSRHHVQPPPSTRPQQQVKVLADLPLLLHQVDQRRRLGGERRRIRRRRCRVWDQVVRGLQVQEEVLVLCWVRFVPSLMAMIW